MLFRFFRRLAWILAHILYRFEVTGMENVPKDGAFLLCSNHINALDPVVLAIFMKRQPRFMGKKELFKTRFLNAFFRALGAFPVDRSTTDMQAFRTSMDILKRGHGILIFSQGTRMKDFENAKSGVALFALKSGAPIIPVGIRGSFRFRSKIYIQVGKPILMDKYKGQKVKTELIETVMDTVVKHVSALQN